MWRDIFNMGSSIGLIRGRYLNKWRGARAEIPYTLDSTPLVLWHTVLRRQLNKNGKHIRPHCQQGGAQRLHEALHRGQCRRYHGALGQCKVQSPKIFFPQDPSFKYDSTSQPKHDGVWSTFTISRHKHNSINTGPVQNTNAHIFVLPSGSNSPDSTPSSGNWTRRLVQVVMATWSTSMTTSWSQRWQYCHKWQFITSA